MTPLAVLIGPPAAGKSRLGKRVSQILGVSFSDTDKMVATRHGAITEIFEKHGEPQFRLWERDAVREALTRDGIVSLGGGAILDEGTQRDLEHCRVLLITATADAIEHRLDAGNRPLLTDGIESWKKLVLQRQPIYDRLADVVIDTSHGTMDSIADKIADLVKESV